MIRSRVIRMAPALLALAVASLAWGADALHNATWNGKDTRGAEVKVPSSECATVILFIRPGQNQSEEAEKMVMAAFRERKDVHLVAVVSGDGADAGALRLVQSDWGKAGLQVVVDGDYGFSGQFGVKVWPTTVVVGRAAATEVAHLAGMPVTFANDLSAYVEFATGRMSQSGLDKALANREVVADSVLQKASRHVEVALRMASKGLNDEAKSEIAKALALKPTDTRILLTMARVDLMAEDTAAAEQLLAQVNATQAPPGEFNLLKGWAAVEKGDWTGARALLTEAVKLNPDPAEAMYLHGRVCEHEGDVKSAAQWYKKAFEHSDKGKEMGVGR